MVKTALLIIGANKISQALLSRIDKSWQITVIDFESENLHKMGKINEQVRTITGDPSSVYQLKQAGIEQIDIVTVLTGDDELNLEVSLLIKEKFPHIKLIASVNRKGQYQRYTDHQIDAIDVPFMISSFILNKIETRASIATDIGLGKGEIVEVTLTSSSKMIGKTLSEIQPIDWVVGAVYRNNELHLPRKDLVFQENDHIIVISHRKRIHSIAEYISTGSYRFPLQFGNNILIILHRLSNWKQTVDESLYLLKNFYAKEAHFVILSTPQKNRKQQHKIEEIKKYIEDHQDNHSIKIDHFSSDLFIKTIMKTYRRGNYGLVILENESFNILHKVGFETLIFKVLKRIHVPVIISKGTFPYNHIMAFDQETDTPLTGIEIGIHIHKKNGAKLSKLLIHPPYFMKDEHESDPIDVDLDKKEIRINNLCKLHNVPISCVRKEGNPIKIVKKYSQDQDLLIATKSAIHHSTILTPSEIQYILHQSNSSALIYIF